MNILDKLNGEHDLATIGLKLLPLIEKHYKPFDGQRAILASGNYSAKFEKVRQAFRDEANKLTNARIITSLQYSARIDFDIHQPVTDGGGSCEYFKDSIYFGDVHTGGYQDPATGIFTYKIDLYAGDGYAEKAAIILATSLADIEQAQADTKAALEALRKAAGSISHVFKETLPTY